MPNHSTGQHWIITFDPMCVIVEDPPLMVTVERRADGSTAFVRNRNIAVPPAQFVREYFVDDDGSITS